MKTLTKKQLAKIMGISASTLQNLLNNTWFEELVDIGYNKNLKILSPKMLQIIFENWGIEFETSEK